jgi:hypothetical protein
MIVPTIVWEISLDRQDAPIFVVASTIDRAIAALDATDRPIVSIKFLTHIDIIDDLLIEENSGR